MRTILGKVVKLLQNLNRWIEIESFFKNFLRIFRNDYANIIREK